MKVSLPARILARNNERITDTHDDGLLIDSKDTAFKGQCFQYTAAVAFLDV